MLYRLTFLPVQIFPEHGSGMPKLNFPENVFPFWGFVPPGSGVSVHDVLPKLWDTERVRSICVKTHQVEVFCAC